LNESHLVPSNFNSLQVEESIDDVTCV